MKLKGIKLVGKFPLNRTFHSRFVRVQELRESRQHRQLWIEFGMWITDDGSGVQNHPNGIWHPDSPDEQAKRRYHLERLGKPVPINLMAKKERPTLMNMALDGDKLFAGIRLKKKS